MKDGLLAKVSKEETVERLNKKIELLEKIQSSYENKMITQNLSSKRLNVLIYGVKEGISKKREDIILNFENFLKNGLK